MSDTREVTESMAPNEVVAFLNDGTQSGSIPTALDDILDDIRDGQLSLHGFDEDDTRVVKTATTSRRLRSCDSLHWFRC